MGVNENINVKLSQYEPPKCGCIIFVWNFIIYSNFVFVY